MKEVNKPFIVVLNTTHPDSAETKELVKNLKEEYDVSVNAVNILEMTEADVDALLKEALSEFDITELNIDIPSFVSVLDKRLAYKVLFDEVMEKSTRNCRKMKNVFDVQQRLYDSGLFSEVAIENLDSGTGQVSIGVEVSDENYHHVLEDILGTKITDQTAFVETLQELVKYKEICSKMGSNMEKFAEQGCGFIIPSPSEMILQEPELIKQSGRYGIKLKAIANVTHVTNVEVESSFEPIIGGEMQAKMLLEHMVEEFNQDPALIWNSEFFGRKLSELICDGVKVKVKEVSEDVEKKYQDSLTKIVNKGRGGVIAIVL